MAASTAKVGRPKVSLRSRLVAKIQVLDDGCWKWTGAFLNTGYGQIYVDGRTATAHRATFEEFRRPIPKGMVLDHLCDNKWCVNPLHLDICTSGANVLRGDGPMARNARKTKCNAGHSLTDSDNVYIYTTKSGTKKRICRACRKDRQQESRNRRKNA